MEPNTKEVTLNGKLFIVKKLSAVEGRSILNLLAYQEKHLDDEVNNKKVSGKLLSCVSVKLDLGNGKDTVLSLTSEDVINNHLNSAKDILTLEGEVMSFNFDFLKDGVQ